MQNHLITKAVVGALTLCGSMGTCAEVLTPAQMNAIALETAMTMNMSMLIQNFDIQPDALSYTGTFNDSGWASTLSGAYAGLPLSVSFTGTFNQALSQGNFTSTGTLGNGPYSGSGSFGFTDIDAQSTGMTWNEGVTLGLNPPPGPPPDKGPFPDRESTGPLVFRLDRTNPTALAIDSIGLVRRTLGGDHIEPGGFAIVDRRNLPMPPPPQPPQVWTASVQIADGASLVGTSDFATGTSHGTLSAVPEPSTVAMFGAGVVVLLGYRWRRKKQRA